MRIAIVGYGRMGHEVETILQERGHQPVLATRGSFPKGCTVGIDFTRGDAVAENVGRAMAAGARYVVGATGWGDVLDEVRRSVEQSGGGLVHAANFSLGVNLFYRIVREAATLLARFPDYDPYVLERHHREKKDSPSGTAKVLAGIVESAGGAHSHPSSGLSGPLAEDAFHVAALRAGGIVGEHTVGFDSGGDEIILEHRARSRRGFGIGAALAAEWIANRTGFHSFDEVIDEVARRS